MGDVNGDGISDFATSNYAYSTSTGIVYLVFGGTSSGSVFESAQSNAGEFEVSDIDGTNGIKLIGIQINEQVGTSIHGGRDLNGDGISDIVIGAIDSDRNSVNSGAAFVVFGGTDAGSVIATAQSNSGDFILSDLDGSNGFIINGEDASDNLGSAVSFVSDINDDGVDDLLVGERRYDANYRGAFHVIFGGTTAGSVISDAVTGSGEFDITDLDGTNGFTYRGQDVQDRLANITGNTLSEIGDVNGDGVADFAVSTSYADRYAAYSSEGETYIIFGGTAAGSAVATALGSGRFLDFSDLDGTNGFIVAGEPGDQSGWSVDGLDDLNGDTIDDLIIGATNYNSGDGGAFIIFGGTDAGSAIANAQTNSGLFSRSDLDGSNGFLLKGIESNNYSGRSVEGDVDLNSDGIDDLLILNGGDTNSGSEISDKSAAILFGGTSAGSAVSDALSAAGSFELSNIDGTNGILLTNLPTGSSDAGAFNRIVGLNDFDGNGSKDIAIGIRYANEAIIIFGPDAADTTQPTPTIAAIDSPTSLTTITGVAVNFDEDVATLETTDFITTGGLTVTTVNGGPQNYTIDLSASGDGVKELQLPAGAVDDLATTPNASLASNVVSFELDTLVPALQSFEFPGITNQTNLLNLDLVFTEPIVVLELSDFTATSGTPSNLQGSGDTYTIDLINIPSGERVINFQVNASTFRDAAGNLNALGGGVGFPFDDVSPALSSPLAPASGQAVPASTMPVILEFSADDGNTLVVDQTGIDLTSSTVPGTLTVSVAAVKSLAPEKGVTTQTIQFTINGATGPGDIVGTLVPANITDTAGNPLDTAGSPATVQFLDNAEVEEWMILNQ